MYLLGAIEKLVYRVDFLEKRLKRTEELVYYLMEGAGNKQEGECGTFVNSLDSYQQGKLYCYKVYAFKKTKNNNILATIWKVTGKFEENLHCYCCPTVRSCRALPQGLHARR